MSHGTYEYELLFSPEFQSMCHSLVVEQHSSPGQQISVSKLNNGDTVIVTGPDCAVKIPGGVSVPVDVVESGDNGDLYAVEFGVPGAGNTLNPQLDAIFSATANEEYQKVFQKDPGGGVYVRVRLYFVHDGPAKAKYFDVEVVDIEFSKSEVRPGANNQFPDYSSESVQVTNNHVEPITLRISDSVRARLDGNETEIQVAAGASKAFTVDGKHLSDSNQDTRVNVLTGGLDTPCGGLPVTVVQPDDYSQAPNDHEVAPVLDTGTTVKWTFDVTITIKDEWDVVLSDAWQGLPVQESVGGGAWTGFSLKPPKPSYAPLTAGGTVLDPVGVLKTLADDTEVEKLLNGDPAYQYEGHWNVTQRIRVGYSRELDGTNTRDRWFVPQVPPEPVHFRGKNSK